MKEGLIFANSRAKAKEMNLFSEERLLRMMECKNIDDAVRILIEVNYAGGMIVDGNDFYDLLIEEERIVTAFVREVAPANVGFECFFLRNDYHNIKALFKAKYGKIDDLTPLILPDGNYKFSKLKEWMDSDKLNFSTFVTEAVKTINKAFETGNGSPRLIDVELDKAMYSDIVARLKLVSDKYILQYFKTLIDSTNILTFLRVTKIHASYAFFANNFVEGGGITLKQFEEVGTDNAKLVKLLSGTVYKEFYDKIIDNDLSQYETMQDNYLLKIFSINKSDMFSVAPIVGYYLAKLNEIKVIRVVLVCIKNKVDFDEMKKRVRLLYA